MKTFLIDLLKTTRRRWGYGLLSALMALTLIVTTPQPAPALPWLDLIIRGVQVFQLSNLSDRQEVALGRQINEQLMSREFRPYRNSAITSYVNQVGQRLVPNSSRPNIPYVFQVVDDSAINAFATMGGYVYVTTGLLTTASNEAELAGVLGHEIAHIAARHSVEKMRETAIAQGLATAAGLDNNTAVAIGVELAIRRPNSREDELEADRLGLQTMQSTGYAPGAMVSFMRKLVSRSSVPSFLSTHPAPASRVEALSRQVDPATANRGSGLDTAAYQSRISALR